MLRREPAGMVVLAGDTEPIELICHLPIVCEDKDIPYCYVPSHKVGKRFTHFKVMCFTELASAFNFEVEALLT